MDAFGGIGVGMWSFAFPIGNLQCWLAARGDVWHSPPGWQHLPFDDGIDMGDMGLEAPWVFRVRYSNFRRMPLL